MLGGNTTGGMGLMPRVVRAFQEQCPETEIFFHVDATERLYESMLQRRSQCVTVIMKRGTTQLIQSTGTNRCTRSPACTSPV